ncbi:hypothetical protein GXA25_11385 [Salmonella enterica]|uniref:Phage protein n=2 Tax=Enterobacteriaceae TaxID=543 RepID=A0A078LQI6_CITKO|nr:MULTISPECIES: hypothetical protein [Escherichia]EAX8378350.1 hypothetical protein [Salmonella enterica]ECA6502313.1 hypothetical protein [Salmonella enterica subsp. enterica serovar Corvallis]ECN1229646.1 hypothetical protein [Salmonella enterica subsp. enterica serovar Enteritidis]ECQ1069910.1 hypothetical protein [Salmonella enterica subsp. enterica serovar Mishmarhaemek]ECX5554868.1 hypothetical protein [Salmonella enterica subsp. enterica serovar Typhimurium]EEI9283429.1 hypothetical p
MDQEMTFSLSYEQLTRKAEEEIKKCNLDKDEYFYGRELDKASALLLFWYQLAIAGYTGVTGNERVEADLVRLKALIVGKEV